MDNCPQVMEHSKVRGVVGTLNEMVEIDKTQQLHILGKATSNITEEIVVDSHFIKDMEVGGDLITVLRTGVIVIVILVGVVTPFFVVYL